LIVAASAIVLGVLAERKILRLPDMLTGRGIAQAGIALGLIFGLASLTTSTVQDWIRVREATKFANLYASVLKKGAIEDVEWYAEPPLRRNGKTPKELHEESLKASPAPDLLDMKKEQTKSLRELLAQKGADLHFVKIENHGMEKIYPVATALFEVHQAPGKESSEGETFALVVMKGVTENRRTDWFVENLIYPYRPESYTPPVQKPDDGHGHTH